MQISIRNVENCIVILNAEFGYVGGNLFSRAVGKGIYAQLGNVTAQFQISDCFFIIKEFIFTANSRINYGSVILRRYPIS